MDHVLQTIMFLNIKIKQAQYCDILKLYILIWIFQPKKYLFIWSCRLTHTLWCLWVKLNTHLCVMCNGYRLKIYNYVCRGLKYIYMHYAQCIFPWVSKSLPILTAIFILSVCVKTGNSLQNDVILTTYIGEAHKDTRARDIPLLFLQPL